MSSAIISLGSNLGDRVASLRGGLQVFAPHLQRLSAVYLTKPWGPVTQPDFLNMVLSVDDPQASAPTWLARCWAAEQAAGRVREVRFGPRTLDADVICVDNQVSTDAVLTLPHPRAHLRAFVLIPWLEICPEAQFPGRGRIADLVTSLSAAERNEVTMVGELAQLIDDGAG